MGFAYNEAYSSMVRQWTGQYKGFPNTKLIYKRNNFKRAKYVVAKDLEIFFKRTNYVV